MPGRILVGSIAPGDRSLGGLGFVLLLDIARKIRGRRPPKLEPGGAALYQLRGPDSGRDGVLPVRTPEDCWSHAAELAPQPVDAGASERFRIKLAVRVQHGQIGAGVLLKDRSCFYSYEMSAPYNGNSVWQSLDLVTPPLSECGPLVINNASAEGSSRGEVRIAEIVRVPPRTVPMANASLRSVHVIEDTIAGNMQELYLDKTVQWLHPNLTFILPDGAIFFETNELGLKGGAVDPFRRQAVVWGDSVVFGIGSGWPCLLDDFIPGYQFLNGGIEGDIYSSVLERAVALNRERKISLNIIMLGWHCHGNNQHVRTDLRTALESIGNPVLATMPTALNAAIVDIDLSSYFSSGDSDSGFYFYGAAEYSVELQQDVFRHITQRNQITREVAQEKGVPLIDLFATFNTEGSTDFRQDFFDILHPRPRSYEKLAHIVAEEIRPLLARD